VRNRIKGDSGKGHLPLVLMIN